MGYPCAVGISAPLSIVRGAGEAAERGILMRSGEAFQGYRLVRQIAFDKTGTLTEGRPRLVELEPTDIGPDELLALAAAVEAASEQPLAEAIVTAAFEQDITPPEVEQFEAVPGKGVRAEVGGETVLAGSPRFLTESDVDLGTLAGRIAALEGRGRTVIAVARCGQPVGLLAMADTVRPEAAGAVAALKQAGVRTVLITGDNEGNARRVAAELGIDQIHAGVLPGKKAELVRGLQRHGRVAMVGDGINDVPALTEADVGVAMGSGTDVAQESADVVLLGNDLVRFVETLAVARRTRSIIWQNFAGTTGVDTFGILLAAFGFLNPLLAAGIHVVSELVFILNSARLLPPPEKTIEAAPEPDPASVTA